jgi:hypothetical protein
MYIYIYRSYVHTYIPMYIHTHVHTCIHTSDRSYLHKCSCSRTFIVSIFLKDPIGCHVIIEQFMSVLFWGFVEGWWCSRICQIIRVWILETTNWSKSQMYFELTYVRFFIKGYSSVLVHAQLPTSCHNNPAEKYLCTCIQLRMYITVYLHVWIITEIFSATFSTLRVMH